MKGLYRLSLSAILIAIIMVSCYSQKPIVEKSPENNSTYKVEYLFEHDGCKVYRFYDRGNYVYFSNCIGNVTAITNDSTKHRTYTIANRK